MNAHDAERLERRKHCSWPQCKKCKSKNTTGEGAPPGICIVECLDCGHKRQVCGAIRAGNKLCGYPPEGESNRCRKCGSSPGRPIITGMRSKAIGPGQLRKMFETALNDPGLLSSRENIATFEMLIGEQLKKLQQEKVEDWASAYKLYRQVRADPEDFTAAEELMALLRDGAEQELVRLKLANLMDGQRRQQETEDKREERLKTTMTAKQALVFAARLEQAVMEEVVDPTIRRRIAERFARLLLDEGLPGAGGAGDASGALALGPG